MADAANHDKEVPAFRAGIDFFREELKKDPAITGIANSSTIPGKLRATSLELPDGLSREDWLELV